MVKLKDIHILWVCDFYDFPRSGAGLVNGSRIYFKHKPDGGIHPGDYYIYAPPQEVWDKLIEKNDLFIKHVGNHWNYVDGKRPKADEVTMKSQSEWPKFYDSDIANQKIDFIDEWEV